MEVTANIDPTEMSEGTTPQGNTIEGKLLAALGAQAATPPHILLIVLWSSDI